MKNSACLLILHNLQCWYILYAIYFAKNLVYNRCVNKNSKEIKMKRVVILGCENSHADSFLKYFKEDPRFSDIKVVGIYSNEPDAAKRLSEEFGVKILENYDCAVGEVDGVIITARHGANHYKYAKPYIASGVPMFIDKPITVDEDEAVEFMRELKANNIRICGGSSINKDTSIIKPLKEEHLNNVGGKTLGGVARSPLNWDEQYGGFFFYAQHLVEGVCEVFGRYPKSVIADKNDDRVNVIFKYDGFEVYGVFIEGNYVYNVTRFSEEKSSGGDLIRNVPGNVWSLMEAEEVYELMSGAESSISYEDFISPVFIMNAIYRALKSGKEEKINTYTV